LGPGYKVLDRYEQQADFFRILRIEKLLTILLLVFILLVASFNLIGSLSMLIIDKKEDIRILSHMGADEPTIRRVFRLEGWLISSLGTLAGLVIGVAICLGQQHFGWLTLGNGSEYVISAYPVQVQATDIVMVALIVLVLGFITAYYPTRNMKAVYLLTALAVCTSCTNPTPAPKRGLPEAYTLAYQEIYGHCYDSLPDVAVVAIDAYSDGLTLDKNHRIKGSGYNLYLSDIFVPDSLLEEGTYRSDTTAQPFTFLPGMEFEGYPHGMYILNVEEDQIVHIQLVDSGSFVYRQDSLLFTLYYRNVYGTKTTYTCHFKGDLLPWLKR